MSKPTLQQSLAIENLCTRWQEADKTEYLRGYGENLQPATVDRRCATRFSTGQKMFHLIIGSSSAFLVDITTGTIYGNKIWAKADYDKIIGNAYDPNFDAAALVRDRFRYGHFENNSNGSFRQPAVVNR